MSMVSNHHARLCRTLAAAAIAALPISAMAFPDNPEVEPNETKAQATPAAGLGALGLLPGDTISGTSTGTSTTVAGAASADTFRVKTAVGLPGIYDNRLVLTSAIVGHTGNILGLSQATGVPTAGTDVTMQTSYIQADTSRMNRWYGFGRQEEIYYRVTGTANTTAPYTATFSSTAVTPSTIADTINAGTITLNTAGSTSDTELWVYDGSFNAIPGYGNDDTPGVGTTSRLQRSFGAGTYYIAVGNFNMGNNLGSPADDNYRVGVVLDFPNAIACNVATTAALNITLTITHSGGTSTTTVTRSTPFEIAWLRMVVAPSAVLGGSGSVSPTTVAIGNQALFTVQVAPAGVPPSTGITVTADLSPIGGSTTQALFDDGTHGDVTAGDNTFSLAYTIPAGTAGGNYTLNWTANDAQARTATGTFNPLTVSAPPAAEDLGTLSSSHTPIVATGTLAAAQVKWYKFRTLEDASATRYYDMTTMGSNLNAPDDTELGLYDSNGNLLAVNDDSGTGAVSPYLNYLSLLSYGQTAPARTYTSPPTMSTQTATGQTGATLPAGTYYLALTGFSASFTAGWIVTSTSTYTGDTRLTLYTNPGPAGCNLADITGIGGPPAVPDGLLTGDDFNAFIAAFAANNLLADVTGIGGPPAVPDGLITGDDFNAFISAFAAGCP